MNHKFNKYVFLFLIGDFLLFYAALSIILVVRSDHWISVEHQFISFLPAFVIYEVILYISGILDRKFVPSPKRVFDLLLRGHAIATILIFVYFYLGNILLGDRMIMPGIILILFSALLFVFIYTWKILRARTFNVKPVKALLIGGDADIEENFSRSNLWDMHIVEKVPTSTDDSVIDEILERNDIGAVIVDIDRYPKLDVLYKLIFRNINILNLVTIKEELSEKIDMDRINELWFITNIRSQEGYLVSLVKRFFDLILAIPVLVIYILSFPILAFLVKKDGGEVFFEMPRVGQAGKVFTIRKFRSMSPDPKEGDKQLVGHEKVVTKIGAFMRKTGLDELPQVMSVIKGDMSFIGPRPEIPSLVEKYEDKIEHYQIRHLVKPGLSGWAQVMQESAPHHTADVELTREKLAYDLYYIKNHSVFLYLVIVMKTVKSLMNRTNHG
ncbi:MAG: sugar transferase [Thiotrichaceae bacterium]